MTTNQKWVLALLIIACLVGVGLWQGGYLDEYLAVKKEIPTGEWPGGTFDLTVAGRNTLDSSTTLTVGTDFTGNWYGYRQGSWVFLGAGSGSGTEIESDPADDGYIWLLCEEISSKYYYADTTMTQSKNTYITDYKWTDANGDTDKEFLYKVSLWNIPPPASGYPARTFYPYFLAESGQGTAANALQWETQPADVTGVGTSTTTKYISWESKLTAEKRAVGVYKVEIVVNSTDTTDWEIDQVNIPGVGYLDGSLFTEDVRSSDTKYQYIIGSDFNNVVYWKVPSGTNNKFDNTVAVKFTLDSGDVLQFTLYIYQWMYDRTSVSDNDPVVYTAD